MIRLPPVVAARILPQFQMYTDPYAALQDADVAAVTTEWDTVKALEPERVKGLLRQPVVLDGRNMFDPEL